MNLNTPNHNLAPTSCGASLATRTLAEVFTPSPEDIATLTTQYRKAVNGLYEAYRFGQMLAQVKARLEQFTSSLTRENASGITVQGANGGTLNPGWNAGTGLRGWIAEHCPEINYKTALRFLAIAEKTNLALAAQSTVDSRQGAASRDGEADGTRDFNGSDGLSTSSASTVGCQLSTVDCEPSEQAVRDFLEGKSQRAVLRLGGKREGAGRKPKDWAAALGESPMVAMKRLEAALVPLNELIVVKALHRLLAPADLETVRGAIDLLRERIWENA